MRGKCTSWPENLRVKMRKLEARVAELQNMGGVQDFRSWYFVPNTDRNIKSAREGVLVNEESRRAPNRVVVLF